MAEEKERISQDSCKEENNVNILLDSYISLLRHHDHHHRLSPLDLLHPFPL